MFCDKLKKARKELGWSQVKVARMLGVTLNAYGLWERGANMPNEENMQKINSMLLKEKNDGK